MWASPCFCNIRPNEINIPGFLLLSWRTAVCAKRCGSKQTIFSTWYILTWPPLSGLGCPKVDDNPLSALSPFHQYTINNIRLGQSEEHVGELPNISSAWLAHYQSYRISRRQSPEFPSWALLHLEQWNLGINQQKEIFNGIMSQSNYENGKIRS